MEGVAELEIVESSISVQVGPVGAGTNEKDATYALVDVRNAGDHNLRVTLGGSLIDGAGNTVSGARPEVLVIPGHGLRTFALVADPPATLDGAARAKVAIQRSSIENYPRSVTIDEGRVYDDRDKVVAKAMAVNHREALARVVVIAGFYGPDKKPMARMFSVFEIEGGQTHPVQFVGPVGSKSAYVFVGDVKY